MERAAEDGDQSVSDSVSVAKVSSASSRQRQESAAITPIENQLVGMYEVFCSGMVSFMGEFLTKLDALAPRQCLSPVHPVSREARDKLLELDRNNLPPSDLFLLMDLFLADALLADTYLALAKDPVRLADVREAWLASHLENIKNPS